MSPSRFRNRGMSDGLMGPGGELRGKRCGFSPGHVGVLATQKRGKDEGNGEGAREKERSEKEGRGRERIQGIFVCLSNTADERLQESVGNILGGSFLRKACRDP